MGGHTLGGTANGDFTSTPTVFNNEYYKNLLKYGEIYSKCCEKTTGGGYVQLSTDRALLQDNFTRSLVEIYAKNESKWYEDYIIAIRKMSLLGQDISVGWCDYEWWLFNEANFSTSEMKQFISIRFLHISFWISSKKTGTLYPESCKYEDVLVVLT